MRDTYGCLRIDEPVKGDKLVIYGQGIINDGSVHPMQVKLYELDLYEALNIPNDGVLNVFIAVENNDQ